MGFRALDALLNLANRGEIVVQFVFVRSGGSLLQAFGIGHHKIQHGFFPLQTLGIAFRVGRSEQRFEHRTGIAHRRCGGGFGAPGKIELIGAGVAGITIARATGFVGGEFQRRDAGQVADLFCGDLIHRDADFDVGTSGFAGLAAGEISGDGARMVARAVAIGPRFVERESFDHLKMFPQAGQRFEGRRKFVIFPRALGEPQIGVHAIRQVNIGKSGRRTRCRRQRGAQRLQHRQGQCRCQTFQKDPPGVHGMCWGGIYRMIALPQMLITHCHSQTCQFNPGAGDFFSVSLNTDPCALMTD